ncbi:MAG: cobalamin-binding protein [Limisphaerales bacterium]
MAGPRIASLLPSATEIVCALGCAEYLVARSHECDYPVSAQNATVCTKSRIDAGASGKEIDEQVKKFSAESLSLFEIDSDKLRELQPSHVLTQAQCDVCAVSEKEMCEVFGVGNGAAPEIVSLSPTRFSHLWDNITEVADALRVPFDGKQLLKGLKQKCVDVIERTAVATRKPKVLCLEWLDPLMGAGNWIPDMVGMAGGENLISESGKHSGWITMDDVSAANPDVIVLMPCGFDLERTLKEAKVLEQYPQWNKLKAVKKQRVFATDGSAFFNRPGPRLVDSLQIFGEIFYPGMIVFGHEMKHWKPVY